MDILLGILTVIGGAALVGVVFYILKFLVGLTKTDLDDKAVDYVEKSFKLKMIDYINNWLAKKKKEDDAE